MCKVLSDTSGNPKQDKELIETPITAASGDENGGTAADTPSNTPVAENRRKVKEPSAS
jgi:hypothetical protein